MKYSKILLRLSLALIVILIAIGLSMQVTAQEGVVQYLEERFKEQNIPVREISILNESPLHLEIVLQGATEWVTWEDTRNLHTARREVFVFARQHGFAVDRLVTILLDNQGKQIYYVDDSFNAELMTVDVSPSILSDEATKDLVTDKFNLFLDKRNLHPMSTIMDISSSDGLQTLDIQVIVRSLEEANEISGAMIAVEWLAYEANAQGAQIVMCYSELKDEKGHVFLKYMYDVQLGHGSIEQDENLTDLSFGHPLPEDAYLPTSPPLPTVTITATP